MEILFSKRLVEFKFICQVVGLLCNSIGENNAEVGGVDFFPVQGCRRFTC